MRRALALAVLVAAAALPAASRANPADTFGLGSRSTALGGAVSADVRDFSANYYNPSGLAFAQGTDLSIGYMYVAHHLTLNGHDSQVDPVRGLMGGVVAPGHILKLPFAFGIATHVSDERLSRARTVDPSVPVWVMYDNRSQLLYLTANLALRPFKWLSIGGGMTFLAATEGAFDISGTAVLPDQLGKRSEYDSQLRHEVDADLTAVRYPEFGITVKPDERFSAGLVYRGQAELNLAIDAKLKGKVDAGLLTVPAQYALESQTLDAFIPRQVVLGTSTKPLDQLRVNVDVVWVQWSAYKSPVSHSVTSLDVPLPKSLLPPATKPSPRTDPRFSDRFVPRIGVEYRIQALDKLELPVRAGYAYEHTPVPDQTGATNFVDTDRHILSLGAGFVLEHPGEVLPGNLRFDVDAQLSVLPKRVTLKESPADFTGDYSARGTILAGGATLSVGFK